MARKRRWWNVGVVKLPHAQRDVAHAVLGERPGDRWQDIVGADTPDEHDRFPIGANCTYRAWLSDAEAQRFRNSSNCRYVSEDVTISDVVHGPQGLPGWRVKRWLDADAAALNSLTGLGVRIAVLDCATSIAMRSYCNLTLAARSVFVTSQPPTNDGYTNGFDHGSLSASTAVPYGGTLLDGVVVDDSNATTDAIVAQAITWAVNNGAKVVNISFGFGSNPGPATLDAFNAAVSADIVFYCSMGNDGINYIAYPAQYCLIVPHVYAVGAYDMSRDRISSFSSYYNGVNTGVAPGEMVGCVAGAGFEAEWYGTSASAPTVTRLAARLISGGATARAAGAALAATVQDMGQSPYQSRGRFDLLRAADYLGITPPAATAVDRKVFAASRPTPGEVLV